MRFACLRKINREKVNEPPGLVIESIRKIMPEKIGGYPIN